MIEALGHRVATPRRPSRNVSQTEEPNHLSHAMLPVPELHMELVGGE